MHAARRAVVADTPACLWGGGATHSLTRPRVAVLNFARAMQPLADGHDHTCQRSFIMPFIGWPAAQSLAGHKSEAATASGPAAQPERAGLWR